jgi:hypothetical protein
VTRLRSRPTAARDARAQFREIADLIPYSFELVDTYVARGGYDPTTEFLFGLDLILDGLERLLEASRS